MRFIVISFLIIFLVGASWAGEISLLDNNILVNKETIVKEKEVVSDQNKILDNVNEIVKNDDFDQMNDFIDEEDEKLKTIKLLNLDLERADLELKKKEIEQKISQLDKSQNVSAMGTQKPSEGEDSPRPDIKLVSIFKNATKKQAMLNINGANFNAQEGQNLHGIVLKAINPQAVTIEYEDGETQSIQIL